jgi:hypothetical protein
VKLTPPSTNAVHLRNELTWWSKIHPVVFDWLANMPPIAAGGVDSGEKLPFSS